MNFAGDGPAMTHVRAIGFHVHLPTLNWLDGPTADYVQVAKAYFRSKAGRHSLDQPADMYRQLGTLPPAIQMLGQVNGANSPGRVTPPEPSVVLAAAHSPRVGERQRCRAARPTGSPLE
jgi:hypothetical protein